MNERIKQLAEQAGFMLWQDEPWNPGDVVDWAARYDDELAKFAELIVRECAGVVEDAVDHREPASTYVNKIKQHFEV